MNMSWNRTPEAARGRNLLRCNRLRRIGATIKVTDSPGSQDGIPRKCPGVSATSRDLRKNALVEGVDPERVDGLVGEERIRGNAIPLVFLRTRRTLGREPGPSMHALADDGGDGGGQGRLFAPHGVVQSPGKSCYTNQGK